MYYIDVGVVDPTCSRYVITHHSATVPLAAASAREADKRAKYTPILARINVNETHFVPFIVECSGHMGKAAEDWMERLKQAARTRLDDSTIAKHINFFKKRLVVSMLRGNGILMDQAARAREVLIPYGRE